MKVYQGCVDYFFGHTSGYGTVKTYVGNIFSSVDLCLIDLQQIVKSYNDNVKDWYIYQYDLDKSIKPIVVKKGESKL